MNHLHVVYTYNNKALLRHTCWINENMMVNYNQYYSLKCLGKNRRLVKKQNIKLVEIYPNHLFPKNKLDEKLHMLVN